MQTATARDEVILDRIAEVAVARARLEAEEASLMLEFADLRRVEAEANEDPRRQALEIGFAADELGVALHQPTRTVQNRLAGTRRVRDLMPRTWAAFVAGRIDAFRVSLIATATASLTTDLNLIHL